jgi:hypothetical protein
MYDDVTLHAHTLTSNYYRGAQGLDIFSIINLCVILRAFSLICVILVNDVARTYMHLFVGMLCMH